MLYVFFPAMLSPMVTWAISRNNAHVRGSTLDDEEIKQHSHFIFEKTFTKT